MWVVFMNENLIGEEQKILDQKIVEIEEIIQDLSSQLQEKRNIDDTTHMDSLIEQQKRYLSAKNQPYFGRLDVNEDGNTETYYIGKTPIVRNYIENIVIDWRSPLGDAFYSYSGGIPKVVVKRSDGNIVEINVKSKRQIHIENQKVKSVSVTGPVTSSNDNTDKANNELTGDNFLVDMLNQPSVGFQLKEIISTIQREQNEIIRLGIRQPVLIQGVAGSGKSTVALHRVSYLLYKYKNLKAENILIIAPNNMFLTYIQSTVRDLDISGIRQTTFASLAKELLPDLREIAEPHQLLVDLVENKKGAKDNLSYDSFKGSMRFKQIVDRYLQHIEEGMERFDTLYLNSDIYLDKSEIQKVYKGYSHLPLMKRNKQLLEWLNDWIDEKKEKIVKSLQEQFESACRQWVYHIDERDPLRRKTYDALEQALNYRLGKIKKEVNSNWSHYQKKIAFLKAIEVYESLFDKDLLMILDPELDPDFAEGIASHFDRNLLRYSDLAALLYIEWKLNDFSKKFDYIIADEAQDLSPFQISILKLLGESMTLLGDISQNVYSTAGIGDWNSLVPDVFEEQQLVRLETWVNYRSSKEIIEVANKIIENSGLDIPRMVSLERHSDEVKIQRVDSEPELLEKLKHSIRYFLEKGYNKIAIIHKDFNRCNNLFKLFTDAGINEIQLVSKGDDTIREKTIIIPSYLVKGLEFDAVIIPNASELNYDSNEIDTKLLFVSVTRAHHGLHVYYHKKASPLLAGCYEEPVTGVGFGEYGIL
jgi:DNA helicase II / ATP-dependent DNA helicase PcrA